jgi:hypothetical protein
LERSRHEMPEPPRRWLLLFSLKYYGILLVKKTPCGAQAPTEPSGIAAALTPRARLSYTRCARETPVRNDISPSPMSHIGGFRSTAATKCLEPPRRWLLFFSLKYHGFLLVKIKRPAGPEHPLNLLIAPRRFGAYTARTPELCRMHTRNTS